MRVDRGPGEEVSLFSDRFLRWVADGRGDVARGRHLFTLRFLDALWDPVGPLTLPYRPTRNPGAFLAMTFDLVGDARHGYLARLEGEAESGDRLEEEIRQHLHERLAAPWPRLVEDLERLALPHLARVVAETTTEALRRPSVSDFPSELARIASWMTKEQYGLLDVEAYEASLPMHRVLGLLRFAVDDERLSDREQHPTGGDLRRMLRGRLDRAWCLAAKAEGEAGMIDFLASWPIDVTWMASQPGEHDFAVAYALASDAPAPGRLWPAAAPYVRDEEREDFELLAGRGREATWVRRTTRLARWGASAVFPLSFGSLDARLAVEVGLDDFHADGMWRQTVAAVADALEVARRHFLQRVADVMADQVVT